MLGNSWPAERPSSFREEFFSLHFIIIVLLFKLNILVFTENNVSAFVAVLLFCTAVFHLILSRGGLNLETEALQQMFESHAIVGPNLARYQEGACPRCPQ
jgi:succinate-acetate transporter protein